MAGWREITAEFAGAVTGALLALFAWGRYATSVRLGATVPAIGGPVASLGAEIIMTLLLVTLILISSTDHASCPSPRRRPVSW